MRLSSVLAAVIIAAPAQADLADQLFKLLPDDGAPGDFFGNSVAISGDTAVVGAYGVGDNGFQSGSAYLFDTTTGLQIAKLLPDDGAPDDRFGTSVAISGATAIVGADQDDDNGEQSGSAYLFDTSTGQQVAKLLPNDGAFNDHFGFSVAISGTAAIVGAERDDDNGTDSGSAYLFDTTTGRQIAKLLPDDGAAYDRFGGSVAISGTTAIVGARLDDDNGPASGSAYVFDISDPANPTQLFKILLLNGAASDRFGASVAISGATAIVGAPQGNRRANGFAYLFAATTGQRIARLVADDGSFGDMFGDSAGISGTTVVVGAWSDDDNGSQSGSAYLFDAITAQQVVKLLASDGAPGDSFGRSVAISGATAIVGALGDDENGDNSGAAYLFDANTCPADIDGDGDADSKDFFAYLDLFASGDDRADIDGDGDIDAKDFFAYLDLFVQPCQ